MESNNQTDLPKKSHKYGSVIPFIVIIILFATNPTEVQFKEFLRNDYKEQARSEDPLSQLLAGPAARLVGLSTNRTRTRLAAPVTQTPSTAVPLGVIAFLHTDIKQNKM